MLTRNELLFCVDPGLKTGLALVKRRDDVLSLSWSDEVDEDVVAPRLRHELRGWQERDGLFSMVVELFFINMKTAKNSQAPWSLEVIGNVKQCLRDAGYPLELVYWQKPSDKDVVTNDALRRLRLWHRGGAGHANVAIKHGVRCLINRGWQSPLLVGGS